MRKILLELEDVDRFVKSNPLEKEINPYTILVLRRLKKIYRPISHLEGLFLFVGDKYFRTADYLCFLSQIKKAFDQAA